MKKLLITVMVLGLVFGLSASVSAGIDDGLVAYYPFDGNVEDAGVYENDGTAHGGFGYVDGVIGQAANFDGIDDYVDIPHDESLKLNRSLTISFFIAPDYQAGHVSNPDNKAVPVVMKNPHPYNNYSSWIDGDLTYVSYQQWADPHTTPFTFWSLFSFCRNQFAHVAMVRDDTVVRTYINGVLVKEYTGVNYEAVQNGASLFIGYDGDYGYKTYKGLIDEVRIYNRALSGAEIETLAAPGGSYDDDQDGIGNACDVADSGNNLPDDKEIAEHILQEALDNGCGDKSDHRVALALKHLGRSLDADLWIDETHVTVKHGLKVFAREKKAVKQLLKVIRDGSVCTTDAQDAIDLMTGVDEALAQAVIDEAAGLCGDAKCQKLIDRAVGQMDKARQRLDDDRPARAVDHFRKAWRLAQSAIKRTSASSDDGDSDDKETDDGDSDE